MAEGQKPAAAAKKPALSSRLMQMKFMQRGNEKTVLKEAVEEQVNNLYRYVLLVARCAHMHMHVHMGFINTMLIS